MLLLNKIDWIQHRIRVRAAWVLDSRYTFWSADPRQQHRLHRRLCGPSSEWQQGRSQLWTDLRLSSHFRSAAPTAKMHAWGGFTMAQKCETPYIPMFEIENVPPWNSSSFSLPSLALAAKSFDSAAICWRPLRFASLMIGVMRPFGVLTAMLMSTFLNCLMKSRC